MMSSTLPAVFARLPVYFQGVRLALGVRISVLLWPTLWAAYIAGDGQPKASTIVGLLLSLLAMVALGGLRDVSTNLSEKPVLMVKEAKILQAVLLVLAMGLPALLAKEALYAAVVALVVVLAYPLLRQRSFLAQGLLAVALSWTIPAAFLLQGKALEPVCWLLAAASVCWLLAVEIYRAIATREADEQAGIKSTALLLGDMDLLMVASLQAMFLLALGMMSARLALAWPFLLALAAMVVLALWQWRQASDRSAAACQKAAQEASWLGALLFVGVFLGYLLKTAGLISTGG